MPIEPRPEVRVTPAAYHGAFDYNELERLDLSPDEVIDFSVNSNPYGPPPGIREAIANVPLDRYPDRECLALRRKLADRHGVSMASIVVGNGASEVLSLIAAAFVERGDKALIPEPTFSEYRRVVEVMGGAVVSIRFDAAWHFAPDYNLMWNALEKHRPKLVFLCHPSNPAGRTYDAVDVSSDVNEFSDTLFVIDEAYIRFGNNIESIYATCGLKPNVLIVRSMTKDYGLAGLRLGYVLGEPSLIAAVAAARPAWNVNALAQAAGLAALDADDAVDASLEQLREATRQLRADLCDLGCDVLPSAVNYFLIKVGNAAAFRAKLLRHKIMVRDCTSFGLPEYIRIATRTPDENAQLVEAVKAVMAAS